MWLSLIVVIPNKNGKICVTIDYQKLNTETITYDYALPFTDGVLDAVAGHEMYRFLDGFSDIIRYTCVLITRKRPLS